MNRWDRERESEVLEFLRRYTQARPEGTLSLLTIPAPRAPLAALWRDDDEPAVLWAHPGGRALAGIGEALVAAAAGEHRFALVGEAAALLEACHVVRHPDAAAVVPALLGGFAFAPQGSGGPWRPFGAARFVLPRWTYELHADGRATLTLALAAGERPEEDAVAAAAAKVLQRLQQPAVLPPLPPVRVAPLAPRRWRNTVDAALAAIAGRGLRKVVLSRAFAVEAETPLSPAAMLARLAAQGNGGYRFAFRVAGKTFLGSSPELLVARRGSEVASEALAGSVGEGDGGEGRLQAFLDDPKEREEHGIVVDAIRAALEQVCDQLDVPSTPVVRRYGDLAHLHTPIRGRLAREAAVSELAALLHPTPAVGGMPAAAACACIARWESVPRGWYAGAVGVLEAGGDGVLAVALRGALVEGCRAQVWAGAGIVAGSTPEREFEETELKARSSLTMLGLSP